MENYIDIKNGLWDLDEDSYAEALLRALENNQMNFNYIKKEAGNAVKRQRRLNRRFENLDDNYYQDKDDFENNMINKIIVDDIRSVLSEEENEILTLKYVYDYSFERIAVIKKVSSMTIFRRLKTINDKIHQQIIKKGLYFE